MGQRLRLTISLLVAVVAALPVSIVATIMLLPLWSWLEASTGIESVGHSGPADWCYAIVFLILAAGAALIVFLRHRVIRKATRNEEAILFKNLQD